MNTPSFSLVSSSSSQNLKQFNKSLIATDRDSLKETRSLLERFERSVVSVLLVRHSFRLLFCF